MCSQKQACQNNKVQNDRAAWVPSQVKVNTSNLTITYKPPTGKVNLQSVIQFFMPIAYVDVVVIAMVVTRKMVSALRLHVVRN